MSKLEQLLQEIHSELGTELLATNVVGMDGLSIANLSASPGFDESAAAARFAMVVKLASKVADKIEMGEVDDNLVTTDQSYILARLLGDGSYYWGVIVTRDATLGLVRMVMNEYVDRLWDAIPH